MIKSILLLLFLYVFGTLIDKPDNLGKRSDRCVTIYLIRELNTLIHKWTKLDEAFRTSADKMKTVNEALERLEGSYDLDV